MLLIKQASPSDPHRHRFYFCIMCIPRPPWSLAPEKLVQVLVHCAYPFAPGRSRSSPRLLTLPRRSLKPATLAPAWEMLSTLPDSAGKASVDMTHYHLPWLPLSMVVSTGLTCPDAGWNAEDPVCLIATLGTQPVQFVVLPLTNPSV